MQELKERDYEHRHEPPSPTAAPRRSVLKNSVSNPKFELSDGLSNDDDSLDASEHPSMRLNPRRASWGDEHGMDLQTVHHGAQRTLTHRVCSTASLTHAESEPRVTIVR